MGDWIVRDTSREEPRERECADEAEAKETKSDMVAIGATPENIEIVPPTQDINPDVVDHSEQAKPDGGAEVVENTTEPERTAPTPEELEADPDIITSVDDLDDGETGIDQLGESLDTDPLSILPSHMKDTIQGQPAVNKRGYAMIAERYDIEVSATIEQYPWGNDEGRCVARAEASTDDGKEYSGWATASADDGDMSDQIIELAETRALKRAVSWASGVGIVSYQEMASKLEEQYQ